MTTNIKELIDTLPQQGEVTWIGIRPQHREPMQSINTVSVSSESGIDGDRYSKSDGSRQVTIIQQEHLTVIGSILARSPVPPELLRRNLVVSGINLLSLKNRVIRVGTATLKVTGLCHPCSKMETALGAGGYNATRGHGGIYATVQFQGVIKIGDTVSALTDVLPG